jgi:hypothetical protein
MRERGEFMNGVAEIFELGQRIAWTLVRLLYSIVMFVCWTLPVLIYHWSQNRTPVSGRLRLGTQLPGGDTPRSGSAGDRFGASPKADASGWVGESARPPRAPVDATPRVDDSGSSRRLSAMTYGDYLRRHG